MFLFRAIARYALGRRDISSAQQSFSENDIILLRCLKDPDRTYLSKPLSHTGSIPTHRGNIPHADLLARTTRSIVCTPKGAKFRATFPTLEEYIVGVRRLVTPVYPVDAAVIVSLLDIHTSPSSPIQILEAGTGHGSLTLQLCRAITCPTRGTVHSVDISARHSKHAESVVRGFRRGIYADCVRFYVGDPEGWCAQHTRIDVPPTTGFLTHAILDLPSPQKYLRSVSAALLPDGVLGVWCPSVSQIMVVVKAVRDRSVPLAMERVVEFPGGAGVGAGLRRWDVRPAVIRSKVRGLKGDVEIGSIPTAAGEGPGEEEEGNGKEVEEDEEEPEPFVCRPTVGDRIVGGGFFALFRRKGAE